MIVFKSISDYYSNDGLKRFDCGNNNLNEYLVKYARQNEYRQISRTFLLLDDLTVIGYYTLATADLDLDCFGLEEAKKLPNYPIPCIRIARLAVDANYQSKGYGKYLLKEIIKKVVSISSVVGIYAIIVDSKNEAVKFYEHFGFKSLETKENTLALSVATLIK